METILITNAILTTPGGDVSPGELLLSEGKITALGRAGEAARPRQAQVIDAKGKRIIPGFIDLHAQGGGGFDVTMATREAITAVAKAHARFGTTSFLATTIVKKGPQGRAHLKEIAELAGKPTGGAAVLGMHIEGPFINPEKRGMIQPDCIFPPGMDPLRDIVDSCHGKLRMMTIAPELAHMERIVAELTARGVVASIGHTAASYEQALNAIEWGARHATHLFNAMSPVHHRGPGAAIAVLMDRRSTMQVIADGVHIHPGVLKMIGLLAGPARIALITDSMPCLGLGDGTYEYQGIPFESREGTARYRDGTLIGTGLPLSGMVKRMTALAGVSLSDSLAMATSVPARVLGLGNRKGVLQAGMDADIAVVDEELNACLTIAGGEIVFQKVTG